MKKTLSFAISSRKLLCLVVFSIFSCCPASAQDAPKKIDEFTATFCSEAAAKLASTDWSTPTDQEEMAVCDAAHALLATAEKSAPDKGEQVRRIFQASPNYLVRMIGNAKQAYADAYKVPMKMKFTAVDGRVVDLDAMRGKVVLIDFRGITHCAACESDEPQIKEVYEKYHDKGFEVISICDDRVPYAGKTIEEAKANVQKYIAAHKLPWPTYFDGYGYMLFDRGQVEGTKPVNPFFRMFDIGGTPTYFLIGKDGLIFPLAPPPEMSHMYMALPGNLEYNVRWALGL